jgi:hypothetical protein
MSRMRNSIKIFYKEMNSSHQINHRLIKPRSSRKRYAKKSHRYNELAGKMTRHRKIKAKKVLSTVKPKKLCRVKAQVECHIVFDKLWLRPSQVMTRWRAYEYLFEISGAHHIADLNRWQCQMVTDRVKSDFPYLFGIQCSNSFI